jgi:hypothetical protein
MKSIDISQVAALAPLLTAGDEEPLFLTRNGETVAAIVPASEQDMESLLLSVNQKFQVLLERAEQRLQTEGGLTADQVRKRLVLPPAAG